MLNDKKGISLIVLIAVVVIVIGAISIVLVINKENILNTQNDEQIATSANNDADVADNLESENEGEDPNATTSNLKFFYDETDWDNLPQKDIEFKISGLVGAPFDLKDFEEYSVDVTGRGIYEQDYKFPADNGTVSGFDLLTDGTRLILPTYGDTDSYHIGIEMKNGLRLRLQVTAPEEYEDTPQNIQQALSTGRYQYLPSGEYDKEIFLDVDMGGLEVREGFLDSEINLLKKTVEKFGKPTQIILNEEFYDNDLRNYQLIYEYNDFVLVINVYEMQYIYGDERDEEMTMVFPRVFGKLAWEQYKQHNSKKN